MANILNKTINSLFASVCALMCIYMCVSCSVMSDSLQPMDCNLPDACVRGILQARILEWVAILFSRGSSWPKGWTWVSCIASRFFTLWATYIYICICICAVFFFSFLPLDSIAKINSKELYLIGLKTKKAKQTNEHLNEIKYYRDLLGLHDTVWKQVWGYWFN